MPEPAKFKESSSSDVAAVMMMFSVGRMGLGVLVAYVGWTFAQEPATLPATVIPWQDTWQAVTSGQATGGEVLVSGRAEAMLGAEALVAPVSGKPALAYRATLAYVQRRPERDGKRTIMRPIVLSNHLAVDRQPPFVVKDGETVVVVRDPVPTWHLPNPSSVRHERQPEAPDWARAMPGFKGRDRLADNAGYESEEIALRPGDAVSLIGVVRQVDGRRELVAPAGKELVGYMRSKSAIEGKLARAGEGARTQRHVAIGAVVIGLLLLMPWELLSRLRRRKDAKASGLAP